MVDEHRLIFIFFIDLEYSELNLNLVLLDLFVASCSHFSLSEQVKLLQHSIDHHPLVLKFAVENDNLREIIEGYQNAFGEEIAEYQNDISRFRDFFQELAERNLRLINEKRMLMDVVKENRISSGGITRLMRFIEKMFNLDHPCLLSEIVVVVVCTYSILDESVQAELIELESQQRADRVQQRLDLKQAEFIAKLHKYKQRSIRLKAELQTTQQEREKLTEELAWARANGNSVNQSTTASSSTSSASQASLLNEKLAQLVNGDNNDLARAMQLKIQVRLQ